MSDAPSFHIDRHPVLVHTFGEEYQGEDVPEKDGFLQRESVEALSFIGTGLFIVLLDIAAYAAFLSLLAMQLPE